MRLYNLRLLCGVWGAAGSTEEEQIGTATAATAHSRFHTKQLEQSEPYFNSTTALRRALWCLYGVPYLLQLTNEEYSESTSRETR